MKYLYLVPFCIHGATVLAHAGHPAPENHGLLAHVLLGFLVGIPLVCGIGFLLKTLAGRKSETVNAHTPPAHETSTSNRRNNSHG